VPGDHGEDARDHRRVFDKRDQPHLGGWVSGFGQ
jgi:hypothetical protein